VTPSRRGYILPDFFYKSFPPEYIQQIIFFIFDPVEFNTDLNQISL